MFCTSVVVGSGVRLVDVLFFFFFESMASALSCVNQPHALVFALVSEPGPITGRGGNPVRADCYTSDIVQWCNYRHGLGIEFQWGGLVLGSPLLWLFRGVFSTSFLAEVLIVAGLVY